MVSSEPTLAVEDNYFSNNMKEMIGGCCVCSDERGWAENPLVYCDGHGCNVAVHQACYGIVQVPTGPWFCRKCESQERAARVIKGWKGRKPVPQTADGGGRSATHPNDAEEEGLAKSLKTMNTWRCELCPHKDGALKRTDNGGWAHVVCALYIPEVEFANVSTMEPIVLQSVPHDRYNKTCYICEEQGRESKAATGACMTCNKHGCRQAFHVTCAQFAGLLCEEEGSDADNVKYCGYCKNHYSKLRRSKRGSSSAYDQSLSDSSSHSLDKHHDKDKKKHKERDKHKPKHKKSAPGLVPPAPALVHSLTVTTEKVNESYTSTSGGGSSMPGSLKRLEETTARFTNANFQEVPAHPTSGKDGSAEVKVGGEGKGKKALGHSTGQKGRKPGAGRTPVGVTVTAATSTSPFQQGAGSHLGTAGSAKTSSGSSVQSPQEFLSFTESDLRNDNYTHSQQSSYTRGLSKGDAAGLEGGLNTFSSLMALPSASSGAAQAKNYENSHRDFSSSASQASAGYKRSQPTSGSVEEDNVKGKKRKGNRSKYGAGRSRGNKAQEAVSSASPASSVASAAGSVNGVNYNNNGSNNISIVQKSPTLLRNGSFHNVSVSSSPAGTGPFAGNDTPVSLPNAVLGSHCSTPIPSSQLPQQSAVHLQHTVPSLPPHTTASVPNLVCATQTNALPGSSLNLAPSHMFGNRLNPNSAMAALIAQSENNPSDQELGDNSRNLAGRGSSPRGSISPRSPVSGSQIRYDQSSSSGFENLPPVATSIEQLLERQCSEGQRFLLEQGAPADILGMLKSLHQLQMENRRLEEQIRILTAKKERLQLLSAQLSVPFPSSAPNPSASSQLQVFAAQPDLLNTNTSPHLSNRFLPDNSLSLPAQDVTSSGQSTSSSSTLSTPPPAGQSPPQQGSGVAGVQQVNSVTVGALASGMQTMTSTIPAMQGVSGLMGSMHGNQLAINGIVGALSGVIQTPASVAQNHSPLSHTAVPPNVSLSLPTTLNSTAPAKSSTPGLGILSGQQRQLLLHQQQLQQLLSSQQPTPEQQQALLYQLMHQQHQHHQQQELQQLQLSAAAQIPMNSLLTSTQAPTQHSISTNPFLAMHGDPSVQKVTRLTEKTGPVVQENS
ncbi:protein AF-10-like isoform X5 [Acipenser ruthenus]|uniref:protein AF-10-like isoform X5 n=1 Tax=Acipenser ruthenus TaxID=7906 RepID=UPI00145B92F0|nr:protein AF-10-like isoform X5 [Acipenser ruthenus]XP_058879137.1 protein AF-10-like isoform X5 [Acipenser ruthenus]XP_058879138.1 protein AF-10-like isoform X5 [Acipenser ruthenus]